MARRLLRRAAELTRELRKVHQFNAFSIAAPLQAGDPLYLERHPDAWRESREFSARSATCYVARLAGSGPIAARAGHDTSSSRTMPRSTTIRGVDRHGIHREVDSRGRRGRDSVVAVLPRTAGEMRIVRLCVAKRDETLVEAAERISAYTKTEKNARMTVRVALVQQPLAWQDPAANRAHFGSVLAPLAGNTGLVVLPEMFTTGFTMKPENYAEAANGKTSEWLLAQASALDAAIGGSVAIRTMAATTTGSCSALPGRPSCINTTSGTCFAWATSIGNSAAATRRSSSSGAARGCVRWCATTCGFPVLSRRRPGARVRVLIYSANWPACAALRMDDAAAGACHRERRVRASE